jgi:hypothetical protein
MLWVVMARRWVLTMLGVLSALGVEQLMGPSSWWLALFWSAVGCWGFWGLLWCCRRSTMSGDASGFNGGVSTGSVADGCPEDAATQSGSASSPRAVLELLERHRGRGGGSAAPAGSDPSLLPL